MNKSLNILGKPDKPSTFLLVWQGNNSEYFCEFVNGKDYETAEYVTISDYCERLKTEIDVSCERVYGRNWRVEK